MTLAAKMLERARKKNTNVLVHGVRESGLTYMAKKGTRGDVKIPGRPNPHAFVQLNPIVRSTADCIRRFRGNTGTGLRKSLTS